MRGFYLLIGLYAAVLSSVMYSSGDIHIWSLFDIQADAGHRWPGTTAVLLSVMYSSGDMHTWSLFDIQADAGHRWPGTTAVLLSVMYSSGDIHTWSLFDIQADAGHRLFQVVTDLVNVFAYIIKAILNFICV